MGLYWLDFQTNAIIAAARNEKYKDIWDSEEQKNAIIAEASFFRAYIFNILANLYGGVPIVDTVFTSPKQILSEIQDKKYMILHGKI